MIQSRALVAVIDDDESVREALPDLLREFGYDAAGFASAEAFLASDQFGRSACLVLDIAMPGMSGLDLQQEMARRGRHLPIVFITAHGDEEVCRRLRRPGAVECLLKPFSDTTLLAALRSLLDSG